MNGEIKLSSYERWIGKWIAPKIEKDIQAFEGPKASLLGQTRVRADFLVSSAHCVYLVAMEALLGALTGEFVISGIRAALFTVLPLSSQGNANPSRNSANVSPSHYDKMKYYMGCTRQSVSGIFDPMAVARRAMRAEVRQFGLCAVGLSVVPSMCAIALGGLLAYRGGWQ